MLEGRAGIRVTRHDFHVVREEEKEGEGVDLKGCLPWDGGGSGDKAADRGGELPRGVGEKAVISSGGNSRSGGSST